ncbi:MAG: imelysin family protein [Ferruginibacter sp.]
MKKLLFITGATLFLASCGKDDATNPSGNIENDKKEAIATYANIVSASYEDSYNAVLNLKTKIDDFVAAPTADKFEAAKTAWKASRIPYGQTEAYRFYDGPIDDADGPEGLINAWPMDESYVDYISTDANSGIINDATNFPTITKETLTDANENGSETNIASGFHAIEFLLWGQDLSTSGPGARPYTDYLTTGGTASNQARRGQYLKAAVDLLAENLSFLVDQWKTGGAYRTTFTSLSTTDALTKMIKGIGELSKGELAGERMTVALTNHDQEDEHSCFSDNTHVDIEMNYKGIENVYKGSYTRTNGTVVSGKSLSSVIAQLNATKNTAVVNQFTDATAKVGIIYTTPPFDQMISASNPTGNDKVNAAITSLQTLADKIADAALALGITISF